MISNEDLHTLFSNFGDISQAYTVKDKKKRKEDIYVGFVIFTDASSVKNVPLEGVPYNDLILKWYNYEMKVAAMSSQVE